MGSSSYAPPTIGISGLTIPTYTAILNYLSTNYQAIYGQTEYLGNDAAIFQFMSILALAMSDVAQMGQLIFNNKSPNFAIGNSLDSIVKINGLARKLASFSTCQVVLTGTAGASISNGLISDVNGNQWSLPSPTVIGGGGTVTVTATCTVAGSVNVNANQITGIVTPTAGWTSVTNGSNLPSVGQPVESDSQLRARQAVSTELPSITMLAGTVAAINAVAGVTRLFVEENPTGSTDANGCPPHSITAVVEGGLDLDVATAIFGNKGIGCFTNGTTTLAVTDPNTGISQNISFDRPTYVPIYVIANVHALPGYTSADTTAIQNALVNYLNSLQIGELVVWMALASTAMAVMPSLQTPIFSIHSLFFGTSASPTTTTDVPMNFNQVAQGVLAKVIVNLV